MTGEKIFVFFYIHFLGIIVTKGGTNENIADNYLTIFFLHYWNQFGFHKFKSPARENMKRSRMQAIMKAEYIFINLKAIPLFLLKKWS